MTIAAKSPSQKASNYAGPVTSVTCAYPNNVAVGSLLTIVVGSMAASSPHTVSASSLTKSAGTATIGTITLDRSEQWLYVGVYPMTLSIFSCLVTGAGSLTMQFAGMPSGSAAFVAIDEYTGSFDSGRVEAVASSNGSSTAPSAGNATSAGAALFVGGTVFFVGATSNPTEDGAFTLIAERSADAGNLGASAIARIVTSGTTDAAAWTLSASGGWSAGAVVYREIAPKANVPYRKPPGIRPAYRYH